MFPSSKSANKATFRTKLYYCKFAVATGYCTILMPLKNSSAKGDLLKLRVSQAFSWELEVGIDKSNRLYSRALVLESFFNPTRS